MVLCWCGLVCASVPTACVRANSMLCLFQVYPEKGTVSFSAGLHGWAFTLTSFAKIYAKKFGTDEVKMMEKLWGDNFFDPKTKKWTKKQTDSTSCKRGFCQFVYEPIKVIIEACMADDKKKLFTMLEKLGIIDKVKSEDKEKTGKPLMKAVMQASLKSHNPLPFFPRIALLLFPQKLHSEDSSNHESSKCCRCCCQQCMCAHACVFCSCISTHTSTLVC